MRQPRQASTTGFFHLASRSAGDVPIFLRATDYRAFLSILHRAIARHEIRLICYAVLPSQWHLVAGPAEPGVLVRAMRWVAATHTGRWRRLRGTDGLGTACWSDFQWECLTAAEDLVQVCRYVERRALRAGLVHKAEDWPWSSVAERFRLSPRLPLVTTAFLTSPSWVDYVNRPLTLLEMRGHQRHAQDSASAADLGDLRLTRRLLVDRAEFPRRFARGPQRPQNLADVVWRTHDDEANAHVECPEHLGIGNVAALCEPLKERRDRPAGAVQRKGGVVGQRPRKILGDPPAGDVRHAFDEAPVE